MKAGSPVAGWQDHSADWYAQMAGLGLAKKDSLASGADRLVGLAGRQADRPCWQQAGRPWARLAGPAGSRLAGQGQAGRTGCLSRTSRRTFSRYSGLVQEF